MPKQQHTSFPERIMLLKQAAQKLHALAGGMLAMTAPAIASELADAADTVMAEVIHMEAAQSRFSARKEQRQTQRASR
jgi:hypothetical protein